MDIRLDGIEIDGRLHDFPIPLADLEALLDEEPDKIDGAGGRRGGFWSWRETGLTAKHTDGIHVLNLRLRVDGPAHRVRIEGRPFDEEFGPTGPTYPSRDLGAGYVGVRRTDPGPDQHVADVIVEQKVRRPKKKTAPAKKKPTPVPDAVEFTDLNFKLLVVQDLMYDKGLLGPSFDLRGFVDGFTGRDIDIDAEGHAPIPEALAYFAELPVPRALLSEVVELEQDGGNDVYMQIAPLWNGEDDSFDVTDFSDVELLPNLRSMTLTGVGEETLESLRKRGIEANLL
ncbi:DUF6892 domain-containing protein [Phytomonospora endophytica]|uniref:DUF6892 domain-containing protein n=1 Tax=Phytomonospora endophytica TaxID=714109 RepID=A0A841G1I6_9ACTN|nr:hypothetical protein [Phytomonospora endophytica]MBB6039517.1 hypothetical protein [Phytomonospora endophytica]GIG70481.1 hypothetical protein Pen01_67760 [Phytomonospora endophytica]